jgi:hypothetical protein
MLHIDVSLSRRILRWVELFCNVDACLKFSKLKWFLPTTVFISDKKIFQGDWCSCWREIYWSNIHDPRVSSKCFRRNFMHRTWTKCGWSLLLSIFPIVAYVDFTFIIGSRKEVYRPSILINSLLESMLLNSVYSVAEFK